MILGTYWYFDFPTDLYKFDYFEFRKGHGGHSDAPAELITNIKTECPGKLISDLKLLISTYNEGFLFIYQDGYKLRIGTGGYQLFDYDFLLVCEVEKILKKGKIKLNSDQKLENPILLKLRNDNPTNKAIYPKKNFLQLVGSGLKKYNAENSKFRLDCNLKLKDKINFLGDLKAISEEENIHVLFYYDKDFDDETNLMIFFTNGRQGLNLAHKQFVNTINFEDRIEEAMTKNNVGLGHKGGFGLYPQDGPRIEMIIDEEFII
ncbi:hypothetical protein ACFSKL_02245 [Belliella marina]|uniref:Uncharacterized protein n=1 Tax=Belliella marina TaxID=1644146 RepID=A0ABW4VFW8_9BACT